MSIKVDETPALPFGEANESQKAPEDPSSQSQKLEIRDMPNSELLQGAGAEMEKSSLKSSSLEAHDMNQIPKIPKKDFAGSVVPEDEPAGCKNGTSNDQQKKRMKEFISCSEEEKEAKKPGEPLESSFDHNDALKLLGECFEPLIKFK